MKNRKTIQGTKFRWDRNWTFYRVRAVLGEAKSEEAWPTLNELEKQNYNEDHQPNWIGHIIALTSPILSRTDVTGIIATERVRIYPPFWLNKKAAISNSFDKVSIPAGDHPLSQSVPIPSHAVRGVLTEFKPDPSSIPVDGLRIDCSPDVELDEILAYFLSIVRQYTKQWWVSSPRNPFDAGVRMDFQLRKNFKPRELPLERGIGETESTWYGAAATQTLIGIEQVLDTKLWLDIGTCFKSGSPPETALQFYLDAIDDYMGYKDTRCILNLALMFEVCENKCLLMDGSKARSKNRDLLRNPSLSPIKLIETFRKIITDRDNIAHGRAPHYYARDFSVIVDYLETSSELLMLYIDKCKAFGWDKAAKLSL